jgi:hypothetical protein
VRPYRRRDRKTAPNDPTEILIRRNHPLDGNIGVGHCAIVERIRREARPQHESIRGRIARRNTEREWIVDECGASERASGTAADDETGRAGSHSQPAAARWIECERDCSHTVTPATPDLGAGSFGERRFMAMATRLRADCAQMSILLQSRTSIKIRDRKNERGAIAGAAFSNLRCDDQRTRLIVNFPKEIPRSTPSPVPASASETVPFVNTCAVLDLTTPACASPCA